MKLISVIFDLMSTQTLILLRTIKFILTLNDDINHRIMQTECEGCREYNNQSFLREEEQCNMREVRERID